MEAVLEAAELDITQTLKENDIRDRHSEEADDVMFDVAILHAYRIFVRICERQGLTVDAPLFADMAADLAEEMAAEAEGD
jgi:hypothetical protein